HPRNVHALCYYTQMVMAMRDRVHAVQWQCAPCRLVSHYAAIAGWTDDRTLRLGSKPGANHPAGDAGGCSRRGPARRALNVMGISRDGRPPDGKFRGARLSENDGPTRN